MTPEEIYKEHGFFIIKRFVPRFFSDYLKEVLHTRRVNGMNQPYIYGDPAFDSFGKMSAPMLSNLVGKELAFSHTLAKILVNDDHQLPHVNKEHLEHTVTVFLGGTYEKLWPIWMQKLDTHLAPQLCALEEGDAVIYMGNKVHHWRDHYEGTDYYQLTMHYVEAEGEHGDRVYDTRPYIGLPDIMKRDDGHTEDQ
jgi:hypothetical protein